MSNGNYTVAVDGQRFNVSVFEEIPKYSSCTTCSTSSSTSTCSSSSIAPSKPVYNGTEAIF